MANIYSCFRTDSSQWDAGKWVLGVDHGQSYFQHAIFIVQDMFDSWGGNISNYFDDYLIFIGENEDYNLNTPCASNPVMESSGSGDAYLYSQWKFGKEEWCNLQGRYTHIVKEASSTAGASIVSICHFGVFGTQYERDTAITSSITVVWGVTTSFDVEDIKSQHDIGNVLDIKLRHKSGAELSFVSF